MIKLLISPGYLHMFIKAINDVHDGIVLVNKDSKILYTNDAYSRILNINKYKVLGKYLCEIEPGALILDVLEKGEPMLNTLVKIKSLGKEVIVNINPIFINKELVGAISIFKDVTEVSILTRELNNMMKLTGYLYNGIVNQQEKLSKSFSEIVGRDEKFLQCLKLASIVAPTDATILVEGESGVGKEVIVNAIYNESSRTKKPFININCSAIPENLFESELFGYCEGSFTGAQKGGKPGKFELADKGTIFLDEIGDMPLMLQAKLLRVLQSGEIQKIGSNKVQKVDVRVIAATNRDLKSMVDKGTFRNDLYYRLNIFNIKIPPLRERKGDIEELANYFLSLYCKKYNKKLEISPEVINVFIKYKWPGNVRELQSCIEFAVVICQQESIFIKHLPENIREVDSPADNNENSHENPLRSIVSDIEKKKIIDALIKTKGNRTYAMELIGMSRRTFYRKLKLYDIDPDSLIK